MKMPPKGTAAVEVWVVETGRQIGEAATPGSGQGTTRGADSSGWDGAPAPLRALEDLCDPRQLRPTVRPTIPNLDAVNEVAGLGQRVPFQKARRCLGCRLRSQARAGLLTRSTPIRLPTSRIRRGP